MIIESICIFPTRKFVRSKLIMKDNLTGGVAKVMETSYASPSFATDLEMKDRIEVVL